MSDFIPLSNLTDDELLGRVYISSDVSPLALELATRLAHALDELRKPKANINDILNRYGRSEPDGTNSGG